MKKQIIIYIIAHLFLSTSNASIRCEGIFETFPTHPEEIQIVKHEQREARRLSAHLMEIFKAESDGLKSRFKGKVLEMDLLCLGAGPQCAEASLVAKKAGIKALVLEKTDLVAKTFAEKDFFINTTEGHHLTMHNFPGGYGSLSYLTSQKYAHSNQLAAHIQSQQFASNVPVMLGVKLISVTIHTIDGIKILELTTDQGITIRTKNLLLGTGLGEVSTKVSDAEYAKALLASHERLKTNPGQLQKLMCTDGFLAALKTARNLNSKIVMPKDIILIGNGDGSRITVEGLQGKNIELPDDFHISWIGNNYATEQDYVKSQEGWDRYLPFIKPHYKKSRIKGISGHVKRVENLANGRIRVTVFDPKTKIETITEGDMIVDSTGYENQNSNFLQGVSTAQNMRDITGPLKEFGYDETVLARQILDNNGIGLPIFPIGPAGGSLATKDELAGLPNKNPVSIFNNISRTAEFVAKLLGITSFKITKGERNERPDLKSPEQIIQELQKVRTQAGSNP